MQLKELADNLGLDEEDFKELLELYVETTSADLQELRAALEAKDTEGIHKKAHSIKGSSGNLGLVELYDIAKAIDDRAREGSLDGLEDLVQDFTLAYEGLTIELGAGS